MFYLGVNGEGAEGWGWTAPADLLNGRDSLGNPSRERLSRDRTVIRTSLMVRTEGSVIHAPTHFHPLCLWYLSLRSVSQIHKYSDFPFLNNKFFKRFSPWYICKNLLILFNYLLRWSSLWRIMKRPRIRVENQWLT